VLHTQVGGPPAPPVKKKSNALPLVLAAAAVVVLAAGGGGAWWWTKHRQALQKPPVAEVAPVPAPVAPPPAPDVSAAPAETAAPADNSMTNQHVLDLVDAKVAPVTIINQIRSAPKTNFDLSNSGVIQLTKGGVPSQVIEVMRNPQAAAPATPVTAARPTAPPTPPPVKSAPPAPAQSTPAPVVAPVTMPPAPVQPAPATPAPAVQVGTNTVLVVPDGKPFNITLAADVPSKLTAGQKINFTITNDVKVGDVLVLAKGTPVPAEVVEPGDSKKFLGVIGGKGKASFKLANVEAIGGAKVTIRATPAHSDKADHPIELQGNKSKDVLAHAGAEYLAYVDGDQTVTIKH